MKGKAQKNLMNMAGEVCLLIGSRPNISASPFDAIRVLGKGGNTDGGP